MFTRLGEIQILAMSAQVVAQTRVSRVGQDRIYMLHIWCLLQGFHQI